MGSEMGMEFTIGPDDSEVSLRNKYADRHQRSRYTDLKVIGNTTPWENPIFNDWLENDDSAKKERERLAHFLKSFCLFVKIYPRKL